MDISLNGIERVPTARFDPSSLESYDWFAKKPKWSNISLLHVMNIPYVLQNPHYL
jgi:hypothetical protein